MDWNLRVLNCHESAWVYGYLSFDEYHRLASEIVTDMLWDKSPRCRDDGDYVECHYEDDNLLLTAHMGVRYDGMHREAYVTSGTAMLEYHDEERDVYIIVEDVEVHPELFEPNLPDVDKNRREAAAERRAMRRDYYRSVM